MILAGVLVIDIPTAFDIATTYALEHDKVCKRDGNCAPLPLIVNAAFQIIRFADAANMVPCRVGIG